MKHQIGDARVTFGVTHPEELIFLFGIELHNQTDISAVDMYFKIMESCGSFDLKWLKENFAKFIYGLNFMHSDMPETFFTNCDIHIAEIYLPSGTNLASKAG